LCFRNLPIKTGNGITETGNGIIWTFQLDSHCPVDDVRLWNFVKSPFLAKVIVFWGLHIQTGNGIIETGNRIIWTFQQDSHCPVDDFRLWNFVKRLILATDIMVQSSSKKFHFFPNFWPLSNTNGKSLPYDTKLTKSLLITPPRFARGGK